MSMTRRANLLCAAIASAGLASYNEACALPFWEAIDLLAAWDAHIDAENERLEQLKLANTPDDF